ncbi:MAG: universal stress protein [Gemmatimonadales bacterium]
MVGVDGSAGSAAALQWAAAEACRRQVALRIVSAWEEPDPAEPGSRYSDRVQIAAARVQTALASVLGRPHLPRQVACAAAEGQTGKVLLDQADNADLLVLGITRLGTELAPGPVGRYCLRHARGPVVFVPGPA